MNLRFILTALLLAMLPGFIACTDSNPSEYDGPPPVGIWRYQTGEISYDDGPDLKYTPCSGLDGQLKLRNDGTWSEWRSLDAMMFPHSGTYTIDEGVISFYKSTGDLFERDAFSVEGNTLTLDIRNPGFRAKCTLTRE